MEEYINKIERFLRGQMSQKEESVFKASLREDTHLRLYAFIVVYMLRNQKPWWIFDNPNFYYYFCIWKQLRVSSTHSSLEPMLVAW